jgi:hypothetical protein
VFVIPKMFSCPRCGFHNMVGHSYCGSCGTQFQYQCFRCGALVDSPFRFCQNCGIKQDWLELHSVQPLHMGHAAYYEPPKPYYQPPNTYSPPNAYYQPQNIQPPPNPYYPPQQPYYRPPDAHGYRRIEPQAYTESASPLKYIGIALVTVLVAGGIILAAVSSSNRPPAPAPTPAITTQLPSAPPATPISFPPAAPSTPEEPATILANLPSYVQQYTDKQPPYLKEGGRISLVNNPAARDASYAELKTFILQDNTDDSPYILGTWTCGNSAEKLHNNAEQAGIKSALVAIHFEDEQIGHALNAFNTTDKGLVYIDCTGRTLKELNVKRLALEKQYSYEVDSVAYLEKGKDFGAISIDKAASLAYSFYVEYEKEVETFFNLLDDFENDSDTFASALGGRTALVEPEYSQFKAWQERLKVKYQTLKDMLGKLGLSFSKPMGILKSVEIYW